MLICTVCQKEYEGENGLSYCCDDCGRCGFCPECADPSQHDCESAVYVVNNEVDKNHEFRRGK